MTWLLLPLMVVMFTSGCATHAVWTKTDLDAWNEPAAGTPVRLFDVQSRHDFLVVYDEHSERHEEIRTRAYFLNESQPRLLVRRAPYFVNPEQAKTYPAIPVYYQPVMAVNPPAKLYAVMGTNGLSLTVYSRLAAGPAPLGEYQLPIYNDGVGKYERAALTPPALVADTALVCCGVGIIYWAAMAGSDGNAGY